MAEMTVSRPSDVGRREAVESWACKRFKICHLCTLSSRQHARAPISSNEVS